MPPKRKPDMLSPEPQLGDEPALPVKSTPVVNEKNSPDKVRSQIDQSNKPAQKISKLVESSNITRKKIKSVLRESISSSSSSLQIGKGRETYRSPGSTSPGRTTRQLGVGGESPAPIRHSEGNTKPLKTPTLTLQDIIVIVVLWSHEIIHVLTDAWTASFLLEHLNRDDMIAQITERIDFLVPKRVDLFVIIILSLMAMVAIPAVTSGKSKFVVLLLGLTVYLVTPIVGSLASNLGTAGLVDTMLVLEVGWSSVKPLRFWLIFHQRFPITVIETRIIVSAGSFMVELTEYVMTIWVTWGAFSHVVFNVVWVLLFVLMVTWLVVICKIRWSFNSIEDQITAIQKEYERSPILDSFHARQKPQRVILVLCLLFPSFMVSFQKSTVSFVFRSIKDNLADIALYRIDLILSLMCLPFTTVCLIGVPVFRQEIRDLVVVGLAHSMNVLVCIFFLVLILNESPSTYHGIMPYSRQTVVQSDVIFGYFISAKLEYENIILTRDGEEQSLGVPHCRGILARKESKALVGGRFPNGTIIFEKNITLTYNTGYYLKKGKLTEIKNFRKYLNTEPPVGQKMVWSLSGLDPCKHRGPQRDEDGTRFEFRNGCHSVKMLLTFTDCGSSVPPVNVKAIVDVPLLGEEPGDKPIRIPLGTERLVVEYIVDGKKQTSNTTVEREYNKHLSSFFFIATDIEGVGDEEYLLCREGPMARFSYEDGRLKTPAGWTARQCQSFASALCVSSVAITLAAASYMHFIWIQCPARHRALILAFFFSINYLAAWIPFLFFDDMGRSEFLVLLVSQVVAGIWHAFSSIAYYIDLRKVADANQKRGNHALF